MGKSKRQRDLARIHIAKKWAMEEVPHFSEDVYRSMISGIMDDLELSGRASSANLTLEGRRRLLEGFERIGWDPRPPKEDRQDGRRIPGKPWGRYPVSGAPGMITQRQADYMAKLEDILGWTSNPDRLVGFIRRQMGIKKGIAMLKNREASSVITGLERLSGRKDHPRSKTRTQSASN